MDSFSSKIKQELSEINNLSNKAQVRAELDGYLLTISNNKFITENQYNINRFAKLLSNIGVNDYKIEMQGKNFCITFKRNIEKKISDIRNNLYYSKDSFQIVMIGDKKYIRNKDGDIEFSLDNLKAYLDSILIENSKISCEKSEISNIDHFVVSNNK